MILLIGLLLLASFLSFCAIVFPFKPFKTRGHALLSFLCLLLVVGITVSIHSPDAAPNHNTAGAPNRTVSTNSEAAPGETGPANWVYMTTKDEMTAQAGVVACTSSTNELQFAFPYDGGSTGKLCFRREGKVLNAWLELTKGQFNCSIETCVLKCKFHDGQIQSFTGEESATHGTGFLFIEPERRLLTATAKARKLKIEEQYYQEGRQVLSFDVAGIDLKRLS